MLNANKNTFSNIAQEWTTKQSFAEATVKGKQRLFEVIFKHIGEIPIHELKPINILKICRVYEKEGKYETAKKVKTKCGQIFRYAISLGLCKRDVTQKI
ncbi:phage integrase central domain-containing protein [Acinetobacter ursingii]|uniref:phage integrase central domain-containing protein n=1 Tax=Acinetobacter ursingii TaxID=108980 RepID=UPI00387E33A9